jgi:hypothetical protein
MNDVTGDGSLVPEPLQRQVACLISTGGPLPRPVQPWILDRLTYTSASEFAIRPRGSEACASAFELFALAFAFGGMALAATLEQAREILRVQLYRSGTYFRRLRLRRF